MAEFGFIGPRGRDAGPPRPLLRTMLGTVLRRHRLAQARTLADVARAAKVSMAYLSELERGRKEASSEVLVAICDALRIELADVLTEVGVRLAPVPANRSANNLANRPVIALRSAARPHHPRSAARGAGDVVCLAA